MDADQLVKDAFPNQAFASFEAACTFIKVAYQTGRWQFRLGKFPLATVKIGKKRVVPIPAIIDFVKQKFAEADENQIANTLLLGLDEVKPTAILPTKRGRGRPPKMPHKASKGGAK